MTARDCRVVDAHVHVNGKYQPLRAWLNGELASPTDGAVLVQQLGRVDNRDIVEAVRESQGHLAGVGLAENAGEADDLLKSGLRGLRMPPCACGHHIEVWEVLQQHSAVASVTGPFDAAASADFRAVMARFDRVHFRLEHLAWLETGRVWRDPDTRRHAITGFRGLAEFPTTSVMWSGFFHNSGDEPPYRASWPVLELTFELFGPQRIMWSGDWNRSGLAPGDYELSRKLVGQLPFLDNASLADVLGRTAATVFGLTLEPSEVDL